MKAIYEFNWDCGRMGELTGLFIAEKGDPEKLIGKEIYFGEVLGKHSEIEGEMEAADLTIKSEDQDFISKFIEIMGDGTISGYNPLAYYDINGCPECGSEEYGASNDDENVTVCYRCDHEWTKSV